MSRAKAMEKSIIKYTTQLFLIVFSVVLGIFVSERIEEQKNKRQAERLLSKITSEVNDNRKLLAYWAPYHRDIANTLDSLSNDELFVDAFVNDKSALFEAILTRGTFMDRTPGSDAWDIAKSHPIIVNFDYDELLILSKIYNQQRVTFEPAEKISEIFFAPDFNAKEKAKSNLQILSNLMREIVGREIRLIAYYTEAEEILDL